VPTSPVDAHNRLTLLHDRLAVLRDEHTSLHATTPVDARKPLTVLRDRLAVLREEHASLHAAYRDGRLPLVPEVARITALNQEVYAIVAEIVRLTRSPDLSRRGG
jgi:hypothetical protein